MKAYKGFDMDLKCCGIQYEVGKEYEEIDDYCGFYAYENPLDVLQNYAPSDSRYCEVDLDANDQAYDDSMRYGKQVRITAEIGLPGLIKAGVEKRFYAMNILLSCVRIVERI